MEGDRDKWWAPVNMVMNVHVPYNMKNFLNSRDMLAYCSKQPQLNNAMAYKTDL
jgi:hypothetical protein